MYFEWIAHPFRPPPELNGGSSAAQVAVIGGGPVGLATALGLARQGIRVVVFEARGAVSDGSRAITIDRRSVQIFDRLGIGDAYRQKAIARRRNLIFYREQLVYE